MSDCCRQSRAEVAIQISNEVNQTWGPPFSQALYLFSGNAGSSFRYAFLAFGHGPRNCIGMRFALYEAKVAIVAMVRRFRLLKTPNTPERIARDPEAQLAVSLEPLWVKAEER